MNNGSDISSNAPVGKGDYVIKAGDSIDSIAETHGHFHETLWNLPDNSELKQVRENRNILLPGDRVTIPDLRPKTETRETDLIHSFKRKGVPAEIRFNVRDDEGVPFEDCDYVLRVGRREYRGKTGPDGSVFHYVSPSARTGELTVQLNRSGYPPTAVWTVDVGLLLPVETVEGVQARLTNLNYDCGAVDGDLGAKTRDAISAFQEDSGLPITGEADDQTRSALEEAHGS
ncbi:MAG: peptidoglycan-binding domain-containing protein [Alphaproteobacteria bacterium]